MASSLIHHTWAHLTSRAHFHGSSTQALTISSAHFLGHHWPTRAHMMHLDPQPHAGMLAQPYFSVHFLIRAQPYILAYYIIRARPKSLGVIRLHQAKITQAGREHRYKVTTWAHWRQQKLRSVSPYLQPTPFSVHKRPYPASVRKFCLRSLHAIREMVRQWRLVSAV